MKQYLISAAVAVASVALALAFFFAGFFVRGWVDQERLVLMPAASGKTAMQTAQTASSPTAVSTPYGAE